MIGSFIFKGVDSSDYLIVNVLPPIYKAAKDITIIEVPGRDGFLTEDLGSYKSITKSVECTIRDLSQIDYICSWLTGSGEVVFSNELTKKYKAVIINQIEFKRVFANYRSFIIQFECQPHKYSLDNSIITLIATGAILNSGSANSKPIIKVFGTGAITLTINSNVVSLTNIVDYVTIDSDLMDAYKDTQLMNNYMSGEFPILISGNNTISWTGTVTKVEITLNLRWI